MFKNLTKKLKQSLKIKQGRYNVELLELICDNNIIDTNTYYLEIYRLEKTVPSKLLTTIEYKFNNDS